VLSTDCDALLDLSARGSPWIRQDVRISVQLSSPDGWELTHLDSSNLLETDSAARSELL